MLERPAGSDPEFSTPAPSLFLVSDAPPVPFSATVSLSCVEIAERLAQPFQPGARPGEFDTQDRKPYRNDDDCRARGHNHHDAYQQYGKTNHTYDDAPSRLVGEMHGSFYQNLPRSSCIRSTLS